MPRIALAPMIAKTEPHFRYLVRQLFPEMWLYTEMISSGAIIYAGEASLSRFLGLHVCEPPIALQLGTHCPNEAYRAVVTARQFCTQQSGRAGQRAHFAEYNLNAGCPSDRVQNRNIGAILMNDAPLVADILAAMRQAVRDTQNLYADHPLPAVTLKHRLGIEHKDLGIAMLQAEQLYRFAERVAPHCDRLIVHARIAILDGLNPKQNREIPPLNYPLVLELRQRFSPLPVEINGGLKTYEQIAQVWPYVDGVMLGRVTYENTWELFRIRQHMLANGWLPFHTPNHTHPNGAKVTGVSSRGQLVGLYAEYLEGHPCQQSIAAQLWPLLNVWNGLPQARLWRQMLCPPYTEQGSPSDVAAQITRRAQAIVQELEQKYADLC